MHAILFSLIGLLMARFLAELMSYLPKKKWWFIIIVILIYMLAMAKVFDITWIPEIYKPEQKEVKHLIT